MDRASHKSRKEISRAVGHGDHEGRHYYTTILARFACIVVATLVVAMIHPHW